MAHENERYYVCLETDNVIILGTAAETSVKSRETVTKIPSIDNNTGAHHEEEPSLDLGLKRRLRRPGIVLHLPEQIVSFVLRPRGTPQHGNGARRLIGGALNPCNYRKNDSTLIPNTVVPKTSV